MFIETSLVVFAIACSYWLGCQRTKIKYDLISIMTPDKYRSFTEIKLYVAKGIIVLLITLNFFQKFNV